MATGEERIQNVGTRNPEPQVVVAAGKARNEPGICPEINGIASSLRYQGFRADGIVDRRYSIADYVQQSDAGWNPALRQQTTAGTVQSVEQRLHSSKECA